MMTYPNVYHGHISWPYISWPYLIAISHGHISWPYLIAIFHCHISWPYLIVISNECRPIRNHPRHPIPRAYPLGPDLYSWKALLLGPSSSLPNL